MNVAVFKEAQQAYARGDYKAALEGFTVCARDMASLPPADLSKFYHLIGNCYVKNGDPHAAAAFYTKALAGSPEKRKPSLYVNLGTALLGTKDYDEALNAFTRALDYPVYTTPYKAYSGIGAAQLKLGRMSEAGEAYRNAALDPTNPAPAKALVNLGVCFMELGRSEDAVSTYEMALEFDLDDTARAKAYANLGQAYMAQGRVQRSLDAFKQATEGGVELSAMAQHDYELAQTLKDRLNAKVPGILNTGSMPQIEAAGHAEALEEKPAEMLPSESGHLPVFGEDGFDPFAPQTQAMEAVTAEDAEEAEGLADDDLAEDAEAEAAGDDFAEDFEAETDVDDDVEGDEPPEDDMGGDETQVLAPIDDEYYEGEDFDEEGATQAFQRLGDYEDVDDEFGIMAAANAAEAEAEFAASQDMHMPSPEDTEFFDITEQQIAMDAREGKRRQRRARGVGLKIALVLVILCILVAGAGCAAYVLGYGYPLQEDTAERFFAAAQAGEDTSQYWASDVDEASRNSQLATLSNVSTYNVDAVSRGMSQTTVYVNGTLEQGGQVEYELVMSRDKIGWAVEYVELHFTSNNS